MKARYWPCLSVKLGSEADPPTPPIRSMATSITEGVMNIRYRIELSEDERCELAGMLKGGKQAVRRLKRAQILLAADAGALFSDAGSLDIGAMPPMPLCGRCQL